MDVKIVLEIAPEDVTELARGHTLITHVAGVTLHIMGSDKMKPRYFWEIKRRGIELIEEAMK